MPPHSYYQPTRTLVSQANNALIEPPVLPRSRFINRFTRKTAFTAGYLVPFMCQEILPGDHVSYRLTAFVRVSTLLFPMLDSQRFDTHFFFCPNRLVWDTWKRFMGEQLDPATTVTDQVMPKIALTNADIAINSLYDHMGVPVTMLTSTININPLPFRMYNLIYNTYYRDQNLINSAVVPLDNGGGTPADYFLRKRAKSHDYFTSALPFQQKFTSPTVPLSGIVPVTGIGTTDQVGAAGPLTVYESTGASANYNNYRYTSDASKGTIKMSGAAGAYPQIFVDLATATGFSINNFRIAMLTQQMYERDARGGTRYTEIVKQHFGVNSPDARLQRPEFIGGGSSPVLFTPIAQTTPTGGGGLGALGATGSSSGQHSATYAATEHGYIIGIMSVKSELSYQQGLHRHWTRTTRNDFYWPTFDGLSEQGVLRQELYATGVDADDTTLFGFQERYGEYRMCYNEVTGIMRSQVAGTLDPWHLAQRFSAPPTLNQTFIEDSPPMDRVLSGGAAAVNQQYIADIQIDRTIVRVMSTYGTPARLGRF